MIEVSPMRPRSMALVSGTTVNAMNTISKFRLYNLQNVSLLIKSFPEPYGKGAFTSM